MLKRRIILALLACGCAAGVFALSGCNDAANQNAALQNQVQQMQDQLNELQGGSQSSGQAAADNSAASSASSAASASHRFRFSGGGANHHFGHAAGQYAFGYHTVDQ